MVASAKSHPQLSTYARGSVQFVLICPVLQVFNTDPSVPEDLTLSLIPEPAGGGPPPPSPPVAFYAPLPARVLDLKRMKTAIPFPQERVKSVDSVQAQANYVVHGALDSVLNLASASADCAKAVAATFPTTSASNGTKSRQAATIRAQMAGLCRNSCLPRLADAASGAARTAAAAWRTVELGPDDAEKAADGVLELRGKAVLAVFADVVRVADGALVTATACATGPQGSPCSDAELDGRLTACSPTSPTGVPLGAATLSLRTLLYPSAIINGPAAAPVAGAGGATCDTACALALDDFAYEEGCCIATRRAAMAAWSAVVFIHPKLAQSFRVHWPGSGAPEDFRSPSLCPASAAAAAAAAGGVDTSCAAAGCGGLAATTSSWPTVQCCDFGPTCANGGTKAWPGSCTCECPAGWAGALCNSDSPHSLLEVVLADVSQRQWFFGGSAIFIATVATVARVPPATLEIDRASDARRALQPALHVRIRILGESSAAAVTVAAMVGSAVQAGVLGAMLAGAGVGSGFATLSAPPSAFNKTLPLCGGQALGCDAASAAQGNTVANGSGEGSNSGLNIVLVVATSATLIAVTGAAMLARSRTIRARASSIPSLLRALLHRDSRESPKEAVWKSHSSRPRPRQRPAPRVESDLVFLDVHDGDYGGKGGSWGGGGGSRSMFLVLGTGGTSVASGITATAAQSAATAVTAAGATAAANPSGGNGWTSAPVMPYWRSGTSEELAASVAMRQGFHPRTAPHQLTPSPHPLNSPIPSAATARPSSAAAAVVAPYAYSKSPPPEQRRFLLEQAITAAAAAALWEKSPAIPDMPSREASIPPPAAVLRRCVALDHSASAAADATASFSVTTVVATTPRSTTARPRGTTLPPSAEQLWEHWRTPLAALQTASPSPRSAEQRGAAVATAAAATASTSLPPNWSGRAPKMRFNFAPHVAASAKWERPASVGAVASAVGAGRGAASADGQGSVFSQLRRKAREAEVRAASAAPAAVE